MARPMPLLLPVTTATLYVSKESVVWRFLTLSWWRRGVEAAERSEASGNSNDSNKGDWSWRFAAQRYCAYPETKQVDHVQVGPGGLMSGRGHRAGRAARKRRQKREGVAQSESLAHQLQYVRLMKFLRQRGFTSTLLQPALFTETGRGLQALQSIKPGQLIISLPESCLLTTSTVLDSYLGPYITRDASERNKGRATRESGRGAKRKRERMRQEEEEEEREEFLGGCDNEDG
ncbi:SET domain-containing protein 4 [Liparis tanakae]|uniref:SET domain-containing protein 4 n=1 Tax=Liparis tanakae TaxID=230148 RepID=A0A4Z2GWR2_9TELE|nr:SET domain-containing protein 4 [Liparis tanakae]